MDTIPGTEPPNPWNFLKYESSVGVFCYVNEGTFGKMPRMGLAARRASCVLDSGNYQSRPSPAPLASGRPVAAGLVKHDYGVKPAQKFKRDIFGDLPGW